MDKKRINEYFEGTPDNIYDSENNITWSWDDDETICFGFFPTNLDGRYEFLTGIHTHRQLASKAAEKLIGKAMGVLTQRYESYVHWIEDQCYDRCYGIGRYWKFNNPKYLDLLCFWYEPSSDMVARIVRYLKIDPSKCLFVFENAEYNDFNDVTVQDYINQGVSGDDENENIEDPFKIDKKVEALIRSYNQPGETFASRKEKKGWNSMAQRNAMLYQEGKEKINEYYEGDPDTIDEFDDETGEYIRGFHYTDPNVISFGYFQTSLDGGKEFLYDEKLSHNDISNSIAKKIIGKAFASEDVDNEFLAIVRYAVYSKAAYKGRIFLNARAVTTWYPVSSEKLAEILNKLGGVEKYSDFVYIIPSKDNSNGNPTVLDYIQSNTRQASNYDEIKMGEDIKSCYNFDPWMIDLIREYNTPNSKLADKTSKLGNMTIAQYNSLIHQEEKEPKKTIKENTDNMEKNKYQEEFSNYTNIMNEALQKGDFKAYEYVKAMLEEAIEENKHENDLMNEMNTTNFGILNHIFENELPTLIKTNKKGVKAVINAIKEDKNLKNQFSFYNVIREQYNDKHDAEKILNKLVDIVVEDIDQKTIKKSNRKLRNIMLENNIIPTEFVDEESKKLYENGDIILTTKRTSNNMIPLIESYDEVCQWMKRHKDDKKKDTKDFDTMIREFEEKLKTNLNESEMSFVQEITDFRSPIAEKRKEKLFNKFKNECITKINEMLKEDSDNAELKELNNQINEMTFNKDSIVKDIAKLLEIRDILMED